MLAVIMGQFLSPMIAVAETVQDSINGDSTPPVSEPTKQSGDSSSENQETEGTSSTESTESSTQVTTESTVEKKEKVNSIQLDVKKSVLKYQEKAEKNADQLFLYGNFKGTDPKEVLDTIDLPESFAVAKDSQKGEVFVRDLEAEKKAQAEAAASKDEKAIEAAKKEILKEIGAYEVTKDNQVKLAFTEFKEALSTDFQLELKGSYTRGPDKADEKKAEKFEVSVGNVKVEVKVEEKEDEKTDDGKNKEDGSSKESTDPDDSNNGGNPTNNNENGSQSKRPVKKQNGIGTLAMPLASGNEGTLNSKLQKGDVSVDLTFYDESEGKEITDLTKPLPLGTKVNFDIKLNLQNLVDPGLVKGDTYTFDLPKEVPATPTGIKPLLDENGDGYGTYEITSDNRVVITITDDTAKNAEVKFSGTLNSDGIDEPGKHTIVYPSEQEIPGPSIIIRPRVAKEISKVGTLDKKQNPTQVTWGVDFNKTYDVLHNAGVNEKFPDDVTFNKVERIIPLSLDFNGNVIPPAADVKPLTEGVDYTVDNKGNVKFIGTDYETIDRPYRIIYLTDIKESARGDGKIAKSTDLVNTATQISDETPDGIDAEATVTAKYLGLLDKNQKGYDKTKQEYTWEVKYNYGQRPILATDKIKDQSTNMILTEEPSVYPVTIKDDGTSQRSTTKLNEGTDYTLVKDSTADGDTWTIQFSQAYLDTLPEGARQAYDITYKTKIKSVVDDSTTAKNDITTNDVDKPGDPFKPDQQNIIKKNEIFNPANSVAKWSMDINFNKQSMTNMVITDTSDAAKDGNMGAPQKSDTRTGNPGVVLVELDDSGNTVKELQEGTDYQLIYYDNNDQPTTTPGDNFDKLNGNGYNRFEVKMIGNYTSTSERFRLTYYTELNMHYVNNDPDQHGYKFDNSANIKWQGDDGDDHESNSHTDYTPSPGQANQGVKYGSYNPITKEITWTTLINYNNYKTPGVFMDDKLKGNQKYVPGSMKIWRGTIAENANINDPANNFENDTEVKVYPSEDGDAYPPSSESYSQKSYVNFDESLATNDNRVTMTIGEMRDQKATDKDAELQKTDYPKAFPGWQNPTANAQRKNVFKVEFKTSLVDQTVTQDLLLNHADTIVNMDNAGLDGKVSMQYTDESAVKTGVYNKKTGLIDWTIWLNRNQSTLYGVVLTDTPSNNQILQPGSFKVYQTTVADTPDKNGNVGNVTVAVDNSNNPVELPTDQYKVTINTLNTETGDQEALIDFHELQENGQDKGTMTRPYKIVYQTRPNFEKLKEEINNDLIINTDGHQTLVPPATKKQTITIDNSTGNATGNQGQIKVIKKGVNGESLAGVTFKLIRHFVGGEYPDQEIAQASVNASGELTFGKLSFTNSIAGHPFVYIIREVGSPFGYTMAEDVNQSLTEKDTLPVNVNIQNAAALRFIKTDKANGHMLGGAKFQLTRDGATDAVDEFTTVANKPYEVDLNKITKDMPKNTTWTFRFNELTPPTGYMKDSSLTGFKVIDDNGTKSAYRLNSDGSQGDLLDLSKVQTLEKLNYKGKTRFEKAGNGTLPVEGAEFTAYKEGTTTEVATGKADANGIVEILNLPVGEYEIRETTAPAGYYLTDDVRYVTIPATNPYPGKEPVFINATDKMGRETPVQNYQSTVKLIKKGLTYDSSNSNFKLTEVANAKFRLVDQNKQAIGFDGKTVTAGNEIDFVSDTDGTLKLDSDPNQKFYFYPGQTYYLEETEAPDYPGITNAKYILNSALFQFTMPAADTVVNEQNKDTPILAGNEGMAIYNYLESVYFTKYAIPDAKETDAAKRIIKQGGAYFELFREVGGDWVSMSDPGSDGKDNANTLEHGAITYTEEGKYKGFYLFRASTDPGKLGQVQAGDLPAGKYRFEEVIPAGGFILPSELGITGATRTFTIQAQSSTPTLTPVDLDEKAKHDSSELDQLINYTGSVTFKKEFYEDSKASVDQTAEFNIYPKGSDVAINPAPLTPDSNGVVYFSGLPLGKYTLKETKVPNNAYIQMADEDFEIEATDVNTDAAKTFDGKDLGTFANYKGRAVFKKINEKKAELSGAKFDLQQKDADGNYVSMGDSFNVISDTQGDAKTNYLVPGDYRLVETEAPLIPNDPNGGRYVVNTTPIDFTIPDKMPATLDNNVSIDKTDHVYKVDKGEFINYLGGFELKKVDGEDTSKGLDGAIFSLYLKDGSADGKLIDDDVKTENGGIISRKDLAPGDYYLKEMTAPVGYVGNKDRIIEFTVVGEFEGDPGIVTSKENLNLTVENYKGQVKFIKKDAANKGIYGATFDLYASDQNGTPEAQPVKGYTDLTTGDGGILEISGLKPGFYVLKEKSTPSSYIKDTHVTKTFEVPEMATYDATGKPPVVETYADGKPLDMINYQGSVKLIKTDGDDQPLADAVFELRMKGSDKVLQTVPSNQSGEVVFNNLAPQTYIITEKEAPDDYIRSTKSLTFTVKAEYDSSDSNQADTTGKPLTITKDDNGKDLTVKNIKGSAEMTKYGTNGALAGATFNVYPEGSRDAVNGTTPLTSGPDGKVTIDGLAPGNYYFQEIDAPTGYLRNPAHVNFTIPAATDQDKVLVDERETTDSNGGTVFEPLALTNYKASVKLIKKQVSKLPGQFDILPGATFKIYQKDGTTEVPGQPEKTSGAQGEVIFTGLAPGEYVIKETEAAPGYQRNTTAINVKVQNETEAPLEVDAGTLVNFKGTAVLEKRGADGKPIIDPDVKTARFDVYDVKNAVTPVQSGLLADPQTGKVTISDLAPGSYYVVETRAVDGYVRNTKQSETFTIDKDATTPDPQTKDDAGNTLNLVNYKATAKLIKTDASGNQKLNGAIFKLYDASGDTLADKREFESGMLQDGTKGNDGEVIFDNLTAGTTYVVKELKAPKGYLRSTKTFTFKTPIFASGEPTVIDTADEGKMELGNVQGQARLQKIDKAGNGLDGATFNVYKKGDDTPVNAAPLESKTVGNVKGLVETGLLAPGEYYFQEVAAAPGYQLNETPVDFTITDKSDQVTTVIVDAGKLQNFKGSAELTKKNEKKETLAGATFTLYQNGQELSHTVTGPDGIAAFKELSPGTYQIKETDPAPGYQLNETELTFVVPDKAVKEEAPIKISSTNDQDGNPLPLEIVNYKGRGELTKKSETGGVLTGATFDLYKDGAKYREALPLESDGVLRVGELPPGDYYFQENTAPAGYLLNKKPTATFTIAKKASAVQTEKVEMINYQGVVELEKSGLTTDGDQKVTNKLDGATFVIKQGDTVIQTQKSENGGLVRFSGLKPGAYTIEETVAAPDYIRSTKIFKVTVPDNALGEPTTITKDTAGDGLALTNVKGSATLKKTDEAEKALPNAVFTAYHKDGTVAQADLISDADGNVTAENLAPGNYYFKETKQPDGYSLNPTEYPFTIPDETASEETVAVKPTPATAVNFKGNIELQKNDEAGDPLQGAEFTLTDAAGKTSTTKSGKDGKVTFTDLAPGDYTLQETAAAKDHQQNDKVFSVTIPADADKHVLITEDKDGAKLELTNFKGKVLLKKQNTTGKGLAGAEFSIYLESDQKKAIQTDLTTEEDGEVLVENLAPGTYVFKETKAPKGYLLNTTVTKDFTISEKASESQTVTKFDDGTDVTMTNYQGQVKLIKNDIESRALADAEFTLTALDDNGSKNVQPQRSAEDGSVIFSNLAPGEYTLVESKAPTGYIQSTKTFNVVIPESAEGQPAIVETDADNNPLILKNVKGTAIMQKTAEDGSALKDAEFQVYTSDEKPVGTPITSDEDGKVTARGLAPGKYYFQETKQPTGYLLNLAKINFVIPETTDQETPVVVATEDMTLQNFKGRAEITKVDAAGKQLAGAEFTLTNATGETIKALTTDETGKVLFEDLAPGEYSVKETKAPTGYQLNPTVMNLVIPAETNQAIVITKDKNGKDLQLTNYQGQAEIQKQDAKGKALAGVEFALYDKAGKVVQEHLLSDADGKVKATGLAPGTYYFKETQAVAGYILNTEPSAEFTISEEASEAKVIKIDDQGKALTMTNYQGSVQLIKTDSTGKQVLKNAVFKLVNETGGTVQANLITDAKGMITVDGLAPGKYSFVETMAPTGYLLDATPVSFTIAGQTKGEPEVVKVTKRNRQSTPPTTGYFPKTGATQAFWAIPTGIGMIGVADAIQRKRKKATKK